VPHETVPPQPSEAVAQFFAPHAALADCGVHPQTFGTPGLPAPQVWPVAQVPPVEPHVSVPVAHPLSIVPQFLPAGHAVSGVQLFAQVPFEHTRPLAQAPARAPQATMPPHPLGIVPQLFDPQTAAAAIGAHPHTFATEGEPPPQDCGDVQPPQLTVPPQPSAMSPQFFPAHATTEVFGVQPHVLAAAPPPHVRGATHVLVQLTIWPQLLRTTPQSMPF
jgi:hypothetical protein